MQTYPKLHNAMWPGLVGKGVGSEPFITLDQMLDLTAGARADGARFQGVDLFLSDPHVSIDAGNDDLRYLADRVAARSLVIGSLVAPVWPETGGGSAMGDDENQSRFLTQVEKACRIGKQLRLIGIRPYGVIRIDSAASPSDWVKSPAEGTRRIANTFRKAADIAGNHGERLAAEGEICWAGMHSWRHMIELLEMVGQPDIVGFQADMAHTLLYTLGYNAPENRLLPDAFDWSDPQLLDAALKTVASALRPWTLDFHVAQNDATVKGLGAHDKTGRHCLPFEPAGKLDLVRHSGFWLRDESGVLTKSFSHICWDGCMFPNEVMLNPETWDDILRAMLSVRNAHGWPESST
jgi:sugar phosphate isomerase/epimerase